MRTEIILAIPSAGLALLTLVIWVLASRKAAEKAVVAERIENFVVRKD